jgi:hypothetical protein
VVSGSASDLPQDEERLMRRRPVMDPAIAESWYFDAGGTIEGPLTPAELLERVRSGQIIDNTMVKKGDSQWVMAADVTGLFEAAFRRQFYYKCPYCGAEVDKPPTVCLGCDREITAVYRVTEKPHAPVKKNPASKAQGESESGASQGSTPAGAHNNAPERRGTVVHAIVGWLRSWVTR